VLPTINANVFTTILPRISIIISSSAAMTVITPLYAMINRLGQLAFLDSSNPSPQTHFELLQMIDQIRLAVETPTETTLRLIYQVTEPSGWRNL
jgi:hypothetical protein